MTAPEREPERQTKLTSAEDGSPFWVIELMGSNWRMLANTDDGLLWADVPDEPGLTPQDIVARWRAGEFDD